MGVADKQTYRDQYHFKDDNKDTSKENPSIQQDPKINTVIKSNPFRSNVEIEGDEIILQPDLSALFKAVGKKHKQGGMDVLLKPDSFVFSDFDGLKISKKEHELFELKEGGTPAKTLKKNIDLKHYNSLVEILDNPYKDDLSKKSATKMLEKYIATLGNIAYIQEEKKGFPTGLPEFSAGTAPVYDTELKSTIDSNKQYAKAGGPIDNPKAQMGMMYWKSRAAAQAAQVPLTRIPVNTPSPSNWGPWEGDKLSTFKDIYGTTNAADKFNNLSDWDKATADLGYTGPKNNLAFQKWLYQRSPEDKAVIDKWHNQYSKGPTAGMFDGKVGIRWTSAVSEIMGKKPVTPQTTPPQSIIPDPIQNITKLPTPEVKDVEGSRQGSKTANWQFTPWQKVSQAYNWGQYANVKRYMPYRSRYTATYVDPALVNPEQAIGDMKGLSAQQLSSLNTLNPILRNAQAASSYGQLLNQMPGVRSQYDNQNSQIVNQSRQYNNQVKNNESMVNMANDQQYYQQAVEGRKNFDNMRQFTANQAMNNTLRDVETNQKLAYNLLTQNNPAYSFDWKTGNFNRTNKSIMDANSTQTNGIYDDILKGIQSLPDSDPKKWDIYERLLRQKNILPYLQQQSPNFYGSQKKGGRIKKNPYK